MILKNISFESYRPTTHSFSSISNHEKMSWASGKREGYVTELANLIIVL